MTKSHKISWMKLPQKENKELMPGHRHTRPSQQVKGNEAKRGKNKHIMTPRTYTSIAT